MTYDACSNENLPHYKKLQITLNGKFMLYNCINRLFSDKSLNMKEISLRDQLKKKRVGNNQKCIFHGSNTQGGKT